MNSLDALPPRLPRGRIQTLATVVAIEGEHAWVEARAKSACGGCETEKSCGMSALSSLVRLQPPRMRVPMTDTLAVGVRVELSMPETALLGAALFAYLLPLVFVFLGGLLGQWQLGTDSGAIAGALFGLLMGFGATLALNLAGRGLALNLAGRGLAPRDIRVRRIDTVTPGIPVAFTDLNHSPTHPRPNP